MSTAPVRRPFLVHRGLHLVPHTGRKRLSFPLRTNEVYKIAAVGAALFLVFTIF